jgi:hypothetical protein
MRLVGKLSGGQSMGATNTSRNVRPGGSWTRNVLPNLITGKIMY